MDFIFLKKTFIVPRAGAGEILVLIYLKDCHFCAFFKLNPSMKILL